MHLSKPLRGKLGHLTLFQNIWKIVIGVGRAVKALCAKAPGISGKHGCGTHQMILKHPLVCKYPNYSLPAPTSNKRGLARTLSSDLCHGSHPSFKSLFWHFQVIKKQAELSWAESHFTCLPKVSSRGPKTNRGPSHWQEPLSNHQVTTQSTGYCLYL